MPFSSPAAAAVKAAFNASAVMGFSAMKVRSTIESFGVGTRMAKPSSLPALSGITSLRALAAPVEVGIMLSAAARARRRSLFGVSGMTWSLVLLWMVVMMTLTRPQVSRTPLTTGARQLVVQLALERMWCLAASYLSWLTPRTIVRSSFLAGAEMMTFLTVFPR